MDALSSVHQWLVCISLCFFERALVFLDGSCGVRHYKRSMTAASFSSEHSDFLSPFIFAAWSDIVNSIMLCRGYHPSCPQVQRTIIGGWPAFYPQLFFLTPRNFNVHDSLKRKEGSYTLLVEAGKGRGIDFWAIDSLLILCDLFFGMPW